MVRELKYCIGGFHDGLNSVEDMLKIPVVEQKERERILDQEQTLHAEVLMFSFMIPGKILGVGLCIFILLS